MSFSDFAATIGLVAGASITYVATRKSSREDLAVQREEQVLVRQLAFDQRIWEARASLYVEINAVVWFLDGATEQPVDWNRLQEMNNSLAAFVARVTTFASESVNTAFHDLNARLSSSVFTGADPAEREANCQATMADPIQRAELIDFGVTLINAMDEDIHELPTGSPASRERLPLWWRHPMKWWQAL